ncbi:hypothetical protein BH24ACT15_BH24ACT15_29230 [soil metagenome]|jgi:hypothetical protein
MTDIPTLLPPDRTPPIRTPDDLLRQWQAFMGPLGFGSRMLWFVFIDHEGHVMPELPCIEDLPITPDRRTLRNVIEMCQEVVASVFDPGTTVAFLLTRPGGALLTASDRAWGQGLVGEGRRAALPMQPVFIANDDEVRLLV